MMNEQPNVSTPRDLLEVQAMLDADGRALAGMPDAGFEARIAAGVMRSRGIGGSARSVTEHQTTLSLVGTPAERPRSLAGSRWVTFAAAAALLLGVFAYVASYRSAPGLQSQGSDTSGRWAAGVQDGNTITSPGAEADTDEYVLALAGLGSQTYSGLSPSEDLGTLLTSDDSDWSDLDILRDVQGNTDQIRVPGEG